MCTPPTGAEADECVGPLTFDADGFEPIPGEFELEPAGSPEPLTPDSLVGKECPLGEEFGFLALRATRPPPSPDTSDSSGVR